MSDVKFSPFVPNGTVNVPPSKSDVHRAIICAAMANGVSRISPVALSNDIKATIGCIKALGADAVLEEPRQVHERQCLGAHLQPQPVPVGREGVWGILGR